MIRKLLFLFIAFLVLGSTEMKAQRSTSEWTLNTNAWTSNYWTEVLVNLGRMVVTDVIVNNREDSILVERIIPSCDAIFPVGIQSEGLRGQNEVYGPYHRAFANPFKHIGDYAIGIDASWNPTVFGLYAGAYFKSQETVFKTNKDNLRGFYFQPRAGISLNFGRKYTTGLQAGVFYDVLTGHGGTLQFKEKDMLKGGWGLDFGLRRTMKNGLSETIIQFTLPLHNFFNDKYRSSDGTISLEGIKRRVGYLFITERIKL